MKATIPFNEMIAGYRDGLSLRDLAMVHCVAHTTVKRCLIRHGVELRDRIDATRIAMRDQRMPLPTDEIARRHLAGESLRSIGRDLGVGHSTIRKALDR